MSFYRIYRFPIVLVAVPEKLLGKGICLSLTWSARFVEYGGLTMLVLINTCLEIVAPFCHKPFNYLSSQRYLILQYSIVTGNTDPNDTDCFGPLWDYSDYRVFVVIGQKCTFVAELTFFRVADIFYCAICAKPV